jgi:hypothetical protein
MGSECGGSKRAGALNGAWAPRPPPVPKKFGRKVPPKAVKAIVKGKGFGQKKKSKGVPSVNPPYAAQTPTVNPPPYILPFHLEDWSKDKDVETLWHNLITTLEGFHREGDTDSIWQLFYRFLGFLLVEETSAWDHVFAPESKCSVQYALTYVNVTNGNELKADVMGYLEGFSKGKSVKLRVLDALDELELVDVIITNITSAVFTICHEGEITETSIPCLQLKASLK